MSVNIKYKNNSIAELTDTGTKTLKTAGKYCEADIVVENTKDGGATITDGIIVKARDADGYPIEFDVYLDNIVQGIFGVQYEASAIRDKLMGSKAQIIHFKKQPTTVSDAGFRYSKLPAAQIEQCFPTLTTTGSGAFTSSLIVNAILPNVTNSYGDEFESCPELKSISMPLATGEIKQYFCPNSGKLETIFLPKKTSMKNECAKNCTSLRLVEIGSIGYPVTTIYYNCFLNDTQTDLNIVVYVVGSYVDGALSNIRNSATNATIIIKAAEATTYNGTEYAAGDTIVTSTVETGGTT